MTQRASEKLVIFDYSGTLSLEAPRFGRQVNLVRALAESGLFSLGVTTPEMFWEEIVGPTWPRQGRKRPSPFLGRSFRPG